MITLPRYGDVSTEERVERAQVARRLRAEGLSYPAIGRRLGCTAGAAYYLLSPEFGRVAAAAGLAAPEPAPRGSMAPRSCPTPDQIRAACRDVQRTWGPEDWFGAPPAGPDLGCPSLVKTSPTYRKLVAILGRARP